MTTVLTAGAFQSMAQLSVALNSAYASLATFFGNDFVREENKIKSAVSRIEREYRTNAIFTGDERRADLTRLRLLRGKVVHQRRRHQSFIDGFMRPASIVGLIIGFAALIYSSYESETPLPFWTSVAIVACNAPFLVGVCGTAVLSTVLEVRVVRIRRNIERKYDSMRGH